MHAGARVPHRGRGLSLSHALASKGRSVSLRAVVRASREKAKAWSVERPLSGSISISLAHEQSLRLGSLEGEQLLKLESLLDEHTPCTTQALQQNA